jgi:cytoskeletal protein RodZ
MEISRYNDTIKQAMRAKGMNVQKVADATGIAPEYINALLERSFDALPAKPYIRGYLSSIAEALEINKEVLWEEYEAERHENHSGEKDVLPSNRYAPRPINKKVLLSIIVVVLLLIITIPKISEFLGRPSLEVTQPKTQRIETVQEQYIIEGVVQDPQDKVLINGDEALVQENGSFEKEVYLEEGNNIFTITATRLLGKETSLSRTIIRIPTSPQDSTLQQDTSSQEDTSTTTPIIE